MATVPPTKVQTVRVIDKRIEPQPEPVYTAAIGPQQNQFYKIPASGTGDSYITFNNLTTLGADRAYLDTFELEITVDVTFEMSEEVVAQLPKYAKGNTRITKEDCIKAYAKKTSEETPSKEQDADSTSESKETRDGIDPGDIGGDDTISDDLGGGDSISDALDGNGGVNGGQPYIPPDYTGGRPTFRGPRRDLWTFESFPFSKCCEEIRVNVNGGAFFSSPLQYLRAKERYWDQKRINDSYGNVCPCNKAWCANEMGGTSHVMDPFARKYAPTRLWSNNHGYGINSTGVDGTKNSDIIKYEDYQLVELSDETPVVYATYRVTWREPVFASPFSSRIDETYGRPLYNITSLDLAFTMQNLGNMIRCCAPGIKSYNVHITDIKLCYQVMTLPITIARPAATIVPYRRYVPYITNSPENGSTEYAPKPDGTPVKGHIKSGLYTLNEVPTAIWVFVGPTKAALQGNEPDGFKLIDSPYMLSTLEGEDFQYYDTAWWDNDAPTWSFNKTFCPLKHIEITCANTTRILSTAEPHDLYRIAKANGCRDSYTQWQKTSYQPPAVDTGCSYSPVDTMEWDVPGIVNPPGGVLRLIPGTDIVIPDQQLIPGANANNMVFQVEVGFDIPDGFPPNYRDVALWLLFEYVGVATITPGQCQIDMNPLGNAVNVNADTPTFSASSFLPASEVEGGGGWLAAISTAISIARATKLLSRFFKMGKTWNPLYSEKASNILNALGFGEPASKKAKRGDGYKDLC